MDETGLIAVIIVALMVTGGFIWWAMRRSQPPQNVMPSLKQVRQTIFRPLPTVCLLFIDGPIQGQKYEIRGKQIRFGRNPECEIRIDDALVSWNHALLSFDSKSNQYILFDQDSTNGTWVNNQRVAQHPVVVGVDQIRIGPAVFVVGQAGQPVPTPTPLPLDAAPPPATESVHEIKDYEFLEKLGHGGSSVIYKARSRRNKGIVAIKILTQADPYLLTKFKNEGGIIPRMLRHPHILRVFGLGEIPQSRQPYIVMEYIPEGTLRDILHPGAPLPLDQVVSIAGQVCDALQYAHRKGVYHRDLKPENIFFVNANLTKLGDFGIARLAQSVTRTSSGYLLGTPLYMSYEQARGIQDIDGRCDIYALGVVLYEMVTGYAPFRADNPLAVVDMHLKTTPIPPSQIAPHVPEHIEMAIMKALEKNREYRFQNTEEMARALGYTAPMHGEEPTGVQQTHGGAGQTRVSRSKTALELLHNGQSMLPLTRQGMNLGRAELDPNDGNLSRQHAAIVYRGGVYWLEDRNSTNGTFVNGQRIFSPHALREGDLIQVGNTELRVVLR